MGKLAARTQGTALRKASPTGGIQSLLEKNWDRIAAVMPKHMSSERLFQLAMSTVNQTPKLGEADPASLLSCIMKCSALGLEPSAVDGLGRAYILPYRNHGRMTATFIMGYKGMIDLARRSGELKSIHAQAVYEGDEFSHWEDETGQHFRFNPNRDASHAPDRLTDVYVNAQLKDGGFVFETMTRAEVEAVRKRSKAATSGPWVTDYEAMALKTVIRRSFRYLPVSVEAQTAAAADETTPDYSGVFRPVAVESDVDDAEAAEPEAVEPADGQPTHDDGQALVDAVCRSCGNVVQVAAGSDPSSVRFECCEQPDYVIREA